MNECKNIVMSGSNLIFYMRSKNITVEELSEGTGISIRAIYKYRMGQQLPGLQHAYAIANYLRMDVTQIWCVFDKN